MSDSATRESLERNLGGFTRIAASRPDLKAASVALCVVRDEQDDLALLLTRRASTLRTHAGQWALPGGRRDPGESIEEAALRELSEETGLQVAESSIVGLLDDYVTRSGYVMSPVIVWAASSDSAGSRPSDASFAGAESEVRKVHLIRSVISTSNRA